MTLAILEMLTMLGISATLRRRTIFQQTSFQWHKRRSNLRTRKSMCVKRASGGLKDRQAEGAHLCLQLQVLETALADAPDYVERFLQKLWGDQDISIPSSPVSYPTEESTKKILCTQCRYIYILDGGRVYIRLLIFLVQSGFMGKAFKGLCILQLGHGSHWPVPVDAIRDESGIPQRFRRYD